MEEERRHASPEGLRSEQYVVSIVKHVGNETSTTQTMKKHIKETQLFRFVFSSCFQSQHFRDLTLYHVFLAAGAIA